MTRIYSTTVGRDYTYTEVHTFSFITPVSNLPHYVREIYQARIKSAELKPPAQSKGWRHSLDLSFVLNDQNQSEKLNNGSNGRLPSDCLVLRLYGETLIWPFIREEIGVQTPEELSGKDVLLYIDKLHERRHLWGISGVSEDK